MRRSLLFLVGLILLVATLLELGALYSRIFPPRYNETYSITQEALQPPIPTRTPPANGFLPGSTVRHTVLEGEDLEQLARCYGTVSQELRSANPQIAAPGEIQEGLIITIPNIGSVSKIYGPPCVTKYTVQAGDSWTSIAAKFNADFLILRYKNPVALTAGGVLTIPLNSAGGLDIICRNPLPLRIPPGKDSITVEGTFNSNTARCFAIGGALARLPLTGIASPHLSRILAGAQTGDSDLSVQITSPDPSLQMAILKSEFQIIKPAYDEDLSWTGSDAQMEGSRMTLSSVGDDSSIPYTIELQSLPAGSVTPTAEAPAFSPMFHIQAEWPQRIEVGDDGIIRVALVSADEDTNTGETTEPGYATSLSTAIPRDTQGVEPGLAFSEGIEALAIASFDTANLDYAPLEYAPKPLSAPLPEWIWTVSPKIPGNKKIVVQIDILWDANDQSLPDTIWGPMTLEIEIVQPLLTIGTLSLSTLLTGSLGSALSFPFLYGIYKEKKEKAQAKPGKKVKRKPGRK